jgi:hypothetical protein
MLSLRRQAIDSRCTGGPVYVQRDSGTGATALRTVRVGQRHDGL